MRWTGGSPSLLITGASVLGLGGALILLSVPVVVRDVLEMPGNAVLERPRVPGEAETVRLERLIASRRQALAWGESGRLWTDLGLAHLMAAEAAEGEKRRSHLEAGEQALERGLALAPASPYGWVRLAYARYLLGGRVPGVADAVRMAVMTGPHERAEGVVFLRLELALNVWDLLSADDRDIMSQQLRFAWRLDAKRLVKIAHATRRTTVARDALRNISGAVEHFDRLERPLLRKPAGRS